MKLSLASVKDWFLRWTFTLPAVLNVAWWVIFYLFLAVSLFGGFIFYQFGLGRAEVPLDPGREPSLRVREELVRGAAAKIRERQAQFMNATATPALPNPFQ